MNRIDIQNSSYADCPIRMILSRISDKWSILTLFTLTQAPVMRFNELQKTIPDISQKMLTVTLRTLEEDGLVKRKIYAQVPPKVEYSLTDRAMSLLPHINSLISWAQENMNDILDDRKSYRKAECHRFPELLEVFVSSITTQFITSLYLVIFRQFIHHIMFSK